MKKRERARAGGPRRTDGREGVIEKNMGHGMSSPLHTRQHYLVIFSKRSNKQHVSVFEDFFIRGGGGEERNLVRFEAAAPNKAKTCWWAHIPTPRT
jgi:hypothetical protein